MIGDGRTLRQVERWTRFIVDFYWNLVKELLNFTQNSEFIVNLSFNQSCSEKDFRKILRTVFCYKTLIYKKMVHWKGSRSVFSKCCSEKVWFFVKLFSCKCTNLLNMALGGSWRHLVNVLTWSIYCFHSYLRGLGTVKISEIFFFGY